MAESRDHYQVLGLTPDAAADEIRQAHRRLVRVLHPDRHHEETPAERALAERRMREINEAWATLKDPARRSVYDSTRRGAQRGSNGAADGTGFGSEPAPRSTGGQPSARNSSKATSSSWTGPGSSASAGAGAYWRRSGHGQPAGSPRRDMDPPSAGIPVAPGVALLLRRGPIVALVVIVLALFIVSAYAGGRGGSRAVQTPPLDACARVIDGSKAVLVSCSMPNDGEVTAQVDAALDCPGATRYVTVGTDFYCIPKAGESIDGG